MSTDTPHRLATRTIAIMALAAVIAIALPTSAAHADHCEVVGCYRECRPVPGGVWCQRRCARRCWRTAEPRYIPPPYDPEPQYEAEPDPEPQYATPSYAPVSTAGSDPLPGLLFLGGVAIIVVLVIAALASAGSATGEMNAATDEAERETAATKALIARLEAAAREADAHLDRFLADTRHPPR